MALKLVRKLVKLLITGGAGFAGHHLIEHILANTEWDIIVIDKLTYAANGWRRLKEIDAYQNPRVQMIPVDITVPFSEGVVSEIGEVDYIVHMAAETHVDNSIINARPFVLTNVLGTYEMLEFARKQQNLKMFLYFSTDEVFGPAPEGTFYKEWDRYNSGNPYAATKAGAEELCLAFENTYDLPIKITHTMNLIGERQHCEKYLPLVINKCITGETLYIHSDASRQHPGKRHYIHCRNMADAVLFILCYDIPAEEIKFNVVGEKEVNNLHFAKLIAEVVGGQLNYELIDFHSARPGHDLRYALDGTLLAEYGWTVPKTFEDSLWKTVKWYLNNPQWLK